MCFFLLLLFFFAFYIHFLDGSHFTDHNHSDIRMDPRVVPQCGGRVGLGALHPWIPTLPVLHQVSDLEQVIQLF